MNKYKPSEEILDAYFNEYIEYILRGRLDYFISSNIYCPSKALEVISNKYKTIRSMPAFLMSCVASNKNASPSLLYKVYNEDKSSLAIMCLALNENTPIDILSDIVDKYCIQTTLHDDSVPLVYNILNNKSTPTHVIQKLIYSFNITPEIYYGIVRHPNCPEDYK